MLRGTRYLTAPAVYRQLLKKLVPAEGMSVLLAKLKQKS